MENTSNVFLTSCFSVYLSVFLLYRYRRKPEVYGIKAQFGIYLAPIENGIIRVGDRIHVLREDKNF
jgi:uncharacterized protein YcbX